MKKENYYSILLMTLFGLAGSILLGFIFYRKAIFIPAKPAFQFVMNGFMGALFLGLLEYRSVRAQTYGIILILAIALLGTGNALTLAYFIRNVLYLAGLLLSILLYYQLLKKNSRISYYLRSFILVSLYALLNIVAGTLVYLINAKEGFPALSFIYQLAIYGALIGLGIGLGADLFLQNRKRILRFLRIVTE
jgi:hypothetical protein